VAVRNCLECRQRQRERVNKTSLISSKTQDALQSVTAAAATKVTQSSATSRNGKSVPLLYRIGK